MSYNFKETNDDSTNICELNDATKDAAPRDFHGRPGYKYYDTQKVCRKVGNWSGVQTKMRQRICGAFRLCLWPLFSNSKVREFKLNFFCEWVKGGVRTPYFLSASEKKMKVYKEKFTSVLFTFTIYGGKQWYYLPDLAKT